MYPKEMTRPMEEELTSHGITALRTAEEVDRIFAHQEGTTLLVVNSVCGCSAASARPAVILSLDSTGKRPKQLLTVFAGVDMEATAKAREYILGYPPSSPSIALFKDGEVVGMIERHQIQGREAEDIAKDLKAMYEQYC